jgi:SAM-dependent methyltransferase
MNDHEIEALDRLESIHWWYLIRKIILLEWTSQFERSSRVLDLGSASGGNTISVRGQGFDVTSLEYSSFGIAIQKRKGLQPIQGDARKLPFPNSSFEIVYCLDVLEHIVEDEAVLNEIFRILVPGGRVLCSVPEDPNLWSAHDESVDHVRRYSRDELIKKVTVAGFHVLNCFSRNTLLRPMIVFMRRFSTGNDLKKTNQFINFVLLQICRAEHAIKIKKFPGVTIWIEAIKHS